MNVPAASSITLAWHEGTQQIGSAPEEISAQIDVVMRMLCAIAAPAPAAHPTSQSGSIAKIVSESEECIVIAGIGGIREAMLGGPLDIPHVYHGGTKTFYFAGT